MSSEMIRKQIYLHKRQVNLLKRLARQRGLSESEIIRQAIDRESEIQVTDLRQMDPLKAIKETTAFAISLRQRAFSGEPYKWNRSEVYTEREKRWNKEEASEQDDTV